MGRTTQISPGAETSAPSVSMPRPAQSIAQRERRRSLNIDSRATGGGSPLAVHTGSVVSHFFAPHPTPGQGLCFSPDGKHLLRYGFSNEIKVLRAENCKVVCCLVSSVGNVRYAAFSACGKYIVAGTEDCRLLVYDATDVSAGHSNLLSNTYVGLEPLLYCLMSPDGKSVLSCDDNGQLELWDVQAKSMTQRFEPGHESKLANFCLGGKRVVSCRDGEIGVAVVDVSSSQIVSVEEFEDLAVGRSKPAYAITRDGGKVVAYTRESEAPLNLALLDVASSKVTSLQTCGGSIAYVEFSSDGQRFLAAGRDDFIHIHCSASGQVLGVLEGHKSDVMFCRMNVDGTYAISGDNSGNVIVWSLETFSPLLYMQAHKTTVLMCDFSLDLTRAITLDGEGQAYMWDMNCLNLFHILRQDSQDLCSIAAPSDNSSLLVGYAEGTVKLWRLKMLNATEVWHQCVHKSPVVVLTLSPCQNILASASRDGSVILTSLEDGALLTCIVASKRTITGVLFDSSGSKLLVSSRDGKMRLWDRVDEAARGQWYEIAPGPIRTFDAASTIAACAMTPDGDLCAAACVCGAVQVWHMSKGSLLWQEQIGDVGASCLCFSPDGLVLLVGGEDGSSVCFHATGGLAQHLGANSAEVSAAYFCTSIIQEGGLMVASREEVQLVTVCARQAVSRKMELSEAAFTADFIADIHGLFHSSFAENRMFIAHGALALYDASLQAAIYDMSQPYVTQAGNSFLFRKATTLLRFGVHNLPLVLYCPPDKPTHMLMDEKGGAKAVDFSSDGHLVVCGNVRGELSIWSVENYGHMKTWMAHKRSAITCVKFSHDGKSVYSCGEDCKVIFWDWQTMSQQAMLSGHGTAVVSVEMSLDGSAMVSGDREGIIILWNTMSHEPDKIIAAHEGAVLGCSISPDGSMIASSGEDEHISIRDSATGKEILSLDDALDGKGLSIKFSFDGTRLQVGGEKGNILVWNVQQGCLVFDIPAHEGKVLDCSWSGDSRQLLSVGADGRVRLWDSASGAEICAANFAEGLGDIETGGFLRGDISLKGATMVGCTSKGHLILWDIHKEFLRCPEGQMLYQLLASMPLSKAKEMYAPLQAACPLIMNVQDSQGWTVLMHAVADSNSEITKLITSSLKPKQPVLGLTASPVSLSSSHGWTHPGHQQGVGEASFASFQASGPPFKDSTLSWLLAGLWPSSRHNQVAPYPVSEVSSSKKDRGKKAAVQSPAATTKGAVLIGPNALAIALNAANPDCISSLLDAILEEKVTSGSYAAVTASIPEIALRYPDLCHRFLTGLPLLDLGEMEIPSSIASQGTIVRGSTSYTSYKEMWHEALELDTVPKGAMVVMQASMIPLPYATDLGNGTFLQKLLESDVPVQTYSSDTVRAIIDYKWKKFAKRKIYTKALVYLSFIAVFTAFAILFAADDPYLSLEEIASDSQGQASIALSVIIFCFGLYYLALEMMQMMELGPSMYCSSFWNALDVVSYCICTIIPPCFIFRVGVGYDNFLSPLVAVQTLLLWVKATFFGLAVDGLGTFIYMTVQLVKGMRYFIVILFLIWIMFGVAFMNLFPAPYVYGDHPPGTALYISPTGEISTENSTESELVDPTEDEMWVQFQNFGRALMTCYMSIYGLTEYGPFEPGPALDTRHPEIAVALICLLNFLTLLLFLPMLILLLRENFKKTRMKQNDVFLHNRAELVIEAESTMSQAGMETHKIPPFLHILAPVRADDLGKNKEAEQGAAEMDLSNIVNETLRLFRQSGVQPGAVATGGDGGGGGGSGSGGGGFDVSSSPFSPKSCLAPSKYLRVSGEATLGQVAALTEQLNRLKSIVQQWKAEQDKAQRISHASQGANVHFQAETEGDRAGGSVSPSHTTTTTTAHTTPPPHTPHPPNEPSVSALSMISSHQGSEDERLVAEASVNSEYQTLDFMLRALQPSGSGAVGSGGVEQPPSVSFSAAESLHHLSSLLDAEGPELSPSTTSKQKKKEAGEIVDMAPWPQL